MFRIFKCVDSTLKYITLKMQPYIEKKGETILKDEKLLKDPVQFTQKLLLFKEEIDIMVKNSFEDDIRFQRNRDISF
jgi:hypothetical protein